MLKAQATFSMDAPDTSLILVYLDSRFLIPGAFSSPGDSQFLGSLIRILSDILNLFVYSHSESFVFQTTRRFKRSTIKKRRAGYHASVIFCRKFSLPENPARDAQAPHRRSLLRDGQLC